MSRETIVGKTKKGKEVGYRVKEGEVLYSIYFKGGGEVPQQLKGTFTDERQCKIAISTYLNKDTLLPEDQAKKDEKKKLSEAKRRPNKLNHKEA